MTILAIFLNLGLLVAVLLLLAREGLPSDDLKGLLLAGLLCGTPIITLIALFVRPRGKNWLGLFLQRKALEEKKKIEALQQTEKDR